MTLRVFVMTDVVGSTALWEAHGEAMRASLELHDQVVHGAMSRAGGRVFKHTGDGMIATFADADDAVGAALHAIADLEHAHWSSTGALAVRASVHAGVATERDGDFFGRPLNRLARMNDIGAGGQVLVSDAARDLMSSPSGRDLGVQQLKDLAEPLRLWQLDDGDHPPLRSLSAVRHSLPTQHSTFVGRLGDVEELIGLLERSRLVTITGVGGCGKTRLAIEVAAQVVHDYDGGVWFVDLAVERADRRVGAAVLEALGITLQDDPDSVDFVDLLAQACAGRRVLLVADNCEHLVDAVADFVAEALDRTDNVDVIATSREALTVEAERVWRIPSLEDSSVELFTDRAIAAGASLPEGDVGLVARICESLDHIPLAIELAAAQSTFMALDDLADRLDDRFTLLGGARRARRQRQQTLQAMMDWSWQLLAREEADLLEELSVLSGAFSLRAAAAVSSEKSEIALVTTLGSLAAQSLVEPLATVGKYRLLETVRLYALDRLLAGGRGSEIRDRHAAWMQSRFGLEAIRALTTTELAERGRERLAEIDEFFAAVEWAEQLDQHTVLADLLHGGYDAFTEKRASEALGWLARLDPPDSDEQANTLIHLTAEAVTLYLAGRYEEAFTAAFRCERLVCELHMAEAHHDLVHGAAWAVFFAYGAHAWAGDTEASNATIELLTAVATAARSDEFEAVGQMAAVDAAIRRDDVASAAAAMDRLEDTYTRYPLAQLESIIEYYRARIGLHEGRFEDALEAVRRLPQLHTTPEMRAQFRELRCLGLIGLGRLGDVVDALRHDRGPQLDFQRDLENRGTLMVIAMAYARLGRTSETTYWASACRDLSDEMAWLFRRGQLNQVLDVPIESLDASALATATSTQLARATSDAIDDIEQLIARA